MKKRFIYLTTAFVLATTAAAGTMGPVSVVFAEASLKAVGEETADTREVKLKNSTGKAIKEIVFYSKEKDTFGENLLSGGDTFEADEQRILYYVPAESEEDIPKYVLRLTFSDDSAVTLHGVTLSDASEDGFDIRLTGDGIGYVSFKSVSEGTEVDTKRVELAYLSSDNASNGEGNEMEAGGMLEECLNDGLIN